MSNTNVFLGKLKRAVKWYEESEPWHNEHADVMAAASRQAIRDIESPGYLYVVVEYDEYGVNDLHVYDNKQTAEQHAERTYGPTSIHVRKVESRLPDWLGRHGRVRT